MNVSCSQDNKLIITGYEIPTQNWWNTGTSSRMNVKYMTRCHDVISDVPETRSPYVSWMYITCIFRIQTAFLLGWLLCQLFIGIWWLCAYRSHFAPTNNKEYRIFVEIQLLSILTFTVMSACRFQILLRNFRHADFVYVTDTYQERALINDCYVHTAIRRQLLSSDSCF